MTGIEETDRETLAEGEYVELDAGNADVHVALSGETTVVCVCSDGEQESVVVESGDVAASRSR